MNETKTVIGSQLCTHLTDSTNWALGICLPHQNMQKCSC